MALLVKQLPLDFLKRIQDKERGQRSPVWSTLGKHDLDKDGREKSGA